MQCLNVYLWCSAGPVDLVNRSIGLAKDRPRQAFAKEISAAYIPANSTPFDEKISRMCFNILTPVVTVTSGFCSCVSI